MKEDERDEGKYKGDRKSVDFKRLYIGSSPFFHFSF